MRVPLFLCSLFWFLSGCSRPADAERGRPTDPPERVVTFTPSITETVFALGAGDLVVGTTDWCRYPPEAKEKAKLGGVGNPSYERILALKPDLFIVSSALTEIADKVEKLGIRALGVRWETLEDVESGIETIGRAIGKEEEARRLRRQMNEDLSRIREKLAFAPPPRVLLVLERQPGTVLDLAVVGSNNVVDTLISLAGGDNIFRASPLPYPKASHEEIVAKDPEYILDFSVHGYSEKGSEAQAKEAWRALPTLKAVREEKVVIMPAGFDLYPGPRIPRMVEAFARVFHPDRFP